MKYFYLYIFSLFLLTNAQAQLSLPGVPIGHLININQEDIPVLEMPSFDFNAMLAEDLINNALKSGPYRFGKNHEVLVNLKNSGAWFEAKEGKLWMLRIQSPGAYAINLTFDAFYMPNGSHLYVYSANKAWTIGKFGEHNNNPEQVFATDFVAGDDIILEYFEPNTVAGQGKLSLFWVTHAYRPVLNIDALIEGFGTSGACNMNVNCPDGLPWEDQKRGVVMLVSGGNGFCTGSLINNTQFDATPYLLTANHCGSSGFGTWVFRFNWEAQGCSNPPASPSFQSLTGAISRANNSTSDFRLLELNNQIPASYNAYFSGWNKTTDPATNTVCIHHPDGDIKKIAFDDQPPATNGNYWQVVWDRNTTTEGGSSGSPLFDQNKRIIGQLFGGSASCTNLTGPDRYGKFDVSWVGGGTSATRLSDWLDPTNTGLQFIDGFDPNNKHTFAIDAALTSVLSAIPTTAVCNNVLPLSIQLANQGTATLTSATIQVRINNVLSQTVSWTGNLVSRTAVAVGLPSLSLMQGYNMVLVSVLNPNNLVDSNITNNTLSFSVMVGSPPILPLPFLVDFQATAMPSSLNVVNHDGAITWARSTTANGFSTGAGSIFMNFFDYTALGQIDYLVTDAFDLKSVTPPVWLSFDVAYARFNGTANDSLAVEVSADCGASWQRIFANGGQNLATNGGAFATRRFTPNASQWRKDSLDLSSFIGNDALQIRFAGINYYGNNLYLDNIMLQTGAPHQLDLGLLAAEKVGLNNNFACVDSLPLTVAVKNYGQQTITSFEVALSFAGNQVSNTLWQGTLAPNQQTTLSLNPTINPGLGNHLFTANLSQINQNPTDGNMANNTLAFIADVVQPKLTVLGDSILCPSDSVWLVLNVSDNVLWSTGSLSKQIYVPSGTYHVWVNQAVCPDSLYVTLNNHVQSPTTLTMPANACQGDSVFAIASGGIFYEWYLNNQLISNQRQSHLLLLNSAVISVQSTDINGCKGNAGPLNTVFNPTPSAPVISHNGTDLLGNVVGNVHSLQWYLNGQPINGANSINFSPNQSGVYTLHHTNQGCESISNSVHFFMLGLDNNPDFEISVYPNPFTNFITVNLNGIEYGQVQVLDVQGRVLVDVAVSQSQNNVNLENFGKGIYLIKVTTPKGIQFFKVLKAI